jgi:SPP1 gp7 family putative phage head morphogenesis protein
MADGKPLQQAMRSGGLASPTGKDAVLRGVHPNAGVEAAYRKALDRLVDEMHNSLVYWISAKYRANTPHMAMDDRGTSRSVGVGEIAAPAALPSMSPAMALREAMRRLSRRWQRRFDKAAPELAKYFSTSTLKHSDTALRAILKKAGFAVEFKLTREANDVLQATIGEQVGLIKSIAQQHLSEVEGMVMRSVSTGRDLGTLTEELRSRYDVTKRRAALIARDQVNKSTANIVRVRQQSLGITQAKWLHSHGGKHPRPSHLDADGKIYDIDKGMYLDGKWTWPGVEINCRCVSRSILPALQPDQGK